MYTPTLAITCILRANSEYQTDSQQMYDIKCIDSHRKKTPHVKISGPIQSTKNQLSSMH